MMNRRELLQNAAMSMGMIVAGAGAPLIGELLPKEDKRIPGQPVLRWVLSDAPNIYYTINVDGTLRVELDIVLRRSYKGKPVEDLKDVVGWKGPEPTAFTGSVNPDRSVTRFQLVWHSLKRGMELEFPIVDCLRVVMRHE